MEMECIICGECSNSELAIEALADKIIAKYKEKADPSIRCCDFLREAIIEIIREDIQC